jgi:hypothetical protein
MRWEDVRSAVKQSAEEFDLLGARPRGMRNPLLSYWTAFGVKSGQLPSERRETLLRLAASHLDSGEPSLFSGDALDQRVARIFGVADVGKDTDLSAASCAGSRQGRPGSTRGVAVGAGLGIWDATSSADAPREKTQVPSGRQLPSGSTRGQP